MSWRSMRRRLALACMALTLAGVFSAMSASGALAD